MTDINLGVGAANSASGGYEITNSLKLEADNNEWLYRASPTAGNRQTYTFSFWIKRIPGTVNAGGNAYVIGAGQHGRMYFGSDFFQFRFDDGHDCRNMSRKFRDPSAWYHFVVAVDTTIASPSSDRVKLYVNGESLEVDDHDGGSFPDQTDQGAFFSTNYLTIGTAPFGGSYNAGDGDFDMRGYLAEFCGVDGQQLAPTDFGEYDSNGIWIPKDVSNINFGSEGFYLKFDDASSSGKDSSGNGNNFSDSNLSAADHATDTPTNNFCTMNSIFKTNDNILVTEGQTKITCGSGTGWLSNVATVALTKGKWYWEVASVTSVYQIFGIADASDDKIPQAAGGYYVGYGSNDTTLSVGMYMINGQAYGNQDGGSGVGIAPSAVGDIMSVCLDLDNLGFYIMRNGVSPTGSDPSSGSSLTGAFTWNDSIYSGYYYPAMSVFQNNGLETNFGGYTSNPISSAASDANGYGSFEYAPPSGYYAICTKNIAEYG
tara:strand:+ start:387 stop:1844 length:1458 start_codon:yes stop_codon:yes gene_type:complete